MTDHELDAVVDHFVRYGNGLFWIARIVVFFRFKHFAVDTTLGVDVSDCLLGTHELHVAVLRHWTCLRPGDTDLDGVGCERMAGNPSQDHSGKQFGNLLSSLIHSAPLLLLYFL